VSLFTDGNTSATSYVKEDSSLKVHSEDIPYADSTRRLSDPGMLTGMWKMSSVCILISTYVRLTSLFQADLYDINCIQYNLAMFTYTDY